MGKKSGVDSYDNLLHGKMKLFSFRLSKFYEVKCMIEDRLRNLRNFLGEKHLDAVVISKPANIQYFSGFTGDDALLVVSMQSTCLITDFRYVEQAAKEAPAFQVIKQEKGLRQKCAEVINGNCLREVGFEGAGISFAWYHEILKELTYADFSHNINLDGLRQLKEEDEIRSIRRAMEIGDIAFKDILTFIKPGVSEIEVAARLENVMRMNGSQGPSFTTIVASGTRGSLPHGTATEKLINRGEFVTMDYGAVYNGYHSDMTRTICVGQADEKQRKVYDTVLQAQLLGVQNVRPGISGKAVDEMVRRQLMEAGLGEYFGHGLGHGVGLEIHEEPRLSPSSTTDALQESMIVTVEPGVYIPDWGGVRIEDSVLVTASGCEILTHSPKELIELAV